MVPSQQWQMNRYGIVSKLNYSFYLKDPCIEVLDKSGRASANSSVRLLKLPLLRGKESIRSMSKQAIVQGILKKYFN